MFREVLAAVDGTPASFRAAALGAEIARAEDGFVDLVAVVEPRGELAQRLHLGGADEEALRAQREADIRSAQALISGKVPVRHCSVEEGPVVRTLLGSCAEAPTDERLICVGAGRHRTGLGSVSAAVVRESACPVLVVREGPSAGPRIERILVGFDATEGAWKAVAAAAELSAGTEASVTLIWVLKPSWPMPAQGLDLLSPEVNDLAGTPERQELDEARRRIEAAGGKVATTGFELGQAPDRLLALSETLDMDLVVVGAHGKSPVRRLFLGGTSDRITARSTRPVLVIR